MSHSNSKISLKLKLSQTPTENKRSQFIPTLNENKIIKCVEYKNVGDRHGYLLTTNDNSIISLVQSNQEICGEQWGVMCQDGLNNNLIHSSEYKRTGDLTCLVGKLVKNVRYSYSKDLNITGDHRNLEGDYIPDNYKFHTMHIIVLTVCNPSIASSDMTYYLAAYTFHNGISHNAYIRWSHTLRITSNDTPNRHDHMIGQALGFEDDIANPNWDFTNQ